MSYINPDLVRSPKSKVSDLEVIKDTGEDGWSLAKLKWEGKQVLAVRWNGNSENVGTPQSRGLPTWFILPDDNHFIELLNKGIS